MDIEEDRILLMTDYKQNSFENYTQTAHWGTDQPFQFFSGNGPDQSFFQPGEEGQGHGNG